jgi:DNA-binding MarR family transcriptional regulator
MTGREELADAFVTASRALVAMAVRSVAAAPVEITLPQHRALVLLATHGSQTVGALASPLGINHSNASRLCDRLERLGLVARRRSASDARSVEISLTQAGRKLLDGVNEHRRNEVIQVLRTMPQADAELTIRALAAFSEAAHEVAAEGWAMSAI